MRAGRRSQLYMPRRWIVSVLWWKQKRHLYDVGVVELNKACIRSLLIFTMLSYPLLIFEDLYLSQRFIHVIDYYSYHTV
jgi:hypothetical protein